MIKANELRIGNLLVDAKDRICKVESIYETGYKAYAIKGALTTGTAEPIPLTEEILLKVGFDRKPFTSGLTFDRFRFTWEPSYEYWYVIDKNTQSYLTKIEYVHELQNFVFVMNRQELSTEVLI